MDTKYVNVLIEEAVRNYKTTSYVYLDEVKTLVFTYLLNGFTYDEFDEKLADLNKKYIKSINRKSKKAFKDVADNVKEKDLKADTGTFEISEEELDRLKFQLDMNSPLKARTKYIRIIKNYYKNTSEILEKEYIDERTFLSRQVDKFDKVEKVVPYYSRTTGEIVSYQNIATYNSMIFNVNLTSTGWNATFESCKELDEDIVYVEPHTYSCPECQIYQGKFYSITGKNLLYPKLENTLWENGGGLKHPNCRHIITTYVGQEESNKYTGPEWEERYEAQQKKRALELKISRLENDLDIYKKLENQEMVDKTNQKLEILANAVEEQKELMKY